VIVSTLAGVGLDFGHVNPVRALFMAAVLNGLLAPVLLVGILIVASHRTLMQNQPSSMLSRVLVAITVVVMVGTAVGMFAP
jgi:Mn2+/Fe2+ NRAMP family transporter